MDLSTHNEGLAQVVAGSGRTRQEKVETERYVLNLALAIFAYFVLGEAIGDKQWVSSCFLSPLAHRNGHCQLRVQNSSL
jgi:hypothetical protein